MVDFLGFCLGSVFFEIDFNALVENFFNGDGVFFIGLFSRHIFTCGLTFRFILRPRHIDDNG